MNDREVLMMAYGALKISVIDQLKFREVVSLIEGHLFNIEECDEIEMGQSPYTSPNDKSRGLHDNG